MQNYKFNLWRDLARTKTLLRMDYASLEAAERDAIKMARALASVGDADDILDAWIEVQGTEGDVQSIIPIRAVAARRPLGLHKQHPAQAA